MQVQPRQSVTPRTLGVLGQRVHSLPQSNLSLTWTSPIQAYAQSVTIAGPRVFRRPPHRSTLAPHGPRHPYLYKSLYGHR